LKQAVDIMKILVIGFGNPGRLDDGLGPVAAAEVEKWDLEDVGVDADYQLTVEHGGDAAAYDYVIFVDASVKGSGPFSFESVDVEESLRFSSHSVSPGGVIGIAQSLFGADTKGFTLGIRGYEFNEFGEHISDAARENLDEALKFLRQILDNREMLQHGGQMN
jgi:hydrogenase maturation protease